ncbi:MAG: glycoside hydrolase family 130 protein [Chloroflexota bacterium]
MFQRHPQNPLIRPQDAAPSRPGFEVIGTFNAGAVVYQGETVLLVRVAERPVQNEAGGNQVLVPYYSPEGELVVREIRRDDPDFDTSDSRFVIHRHTGELFLTSISHLRLARSRNGVRFELEPAPWLKAGQAEEAFGVEDARITPVGNRYYVNYTAVSPLGIATGLVSTHDFAAVERHGIIFPPANRDVTLFPCQINGRYVCYHRPMPGMFGGYNIWMAESPDLRHWGNHRPVLRAQPGGWESGRVGGGAPPIWTERGWLSIYHAADRQDRYCLGAFLTPHDDPVRVIARAREPIFQPEAPYEVEGFFGNVVFTCGVVLAGDTLRLYYGAADESVCLAEAPLAAVLDALA